MAPRQRGNKDPKSRESGAARLRGMLRGDGDGERRPSSRSDLYGGGTTGHLLQGRFHTAKVYGWFQRQHTKGVQLVDDDGYYRRNDHEWKIPYGLRIALHQPLLPPQYTTQWPFYVLWTSPRTGKKYKKFFGTMPQAIKFVAEKAQYVDPDASVVGRHVRDIPPKLRGKFPRTMGGHNHYWCGYCMAPRRFRRRYPEEKFSALKKFWSEEKGRYVEKEVTLAVIECRVCHGTNRDARF